MQPEPVNSDNKIRCNLCGPSVGRSDENSDRPPSVRELSQRLFGDEYGEALDAAKELIAAGSQYFGIVHEALNDPRLETLRTGILLELATLGERTLPLAKTVAKFLDDRKMPSNVTAPAAYALSKMGPEADPTIHAWMEETPSSAWNSWPGSLFQFMGEDRSIAFLQTALQSGGGDRQIWACKMIASVFTHPWQALLPDLVAVLPNSDDWKRKAVIDAIVNVGQPAVETMWEMTENHRAEVRASGLTALAGYATCDPNQLCSIDSIGDNAIARLSAKMTDPEPIVRIAAAVALQKVAVAASNTQLLSEFPKADTDLKIQIARGIQDCVVNQHGFRTLQVCFRHCIDMTDGNLFLRRRLAAVDLATNSGLHADTTSPLLSGLCDWEDPWRHEYLQAVRVAELRALALLPGVVVCTAADPSLQVPALEIIGALGEHASDEAVDRAIVCLSSSHLEVRAAAAQALGDIGPSKRAVAIALTKAVVDPSSGISSTACAALGKMKKLASDAVPYIASAANRLGWTAVEALARINTEQARIAVLSIYQDACQRGDEDDVDMREEARGLLEEWGMLPSPASDATNQRSDITGETT